MLSVAGKPLVQCVVEELLPNGIPDFLLVTGRDTASIEYHFDHDPEIFRIPAERSKRDLLKAMDMRGVRKPMAMGDGVERDQAGEFLGDPESFSELAFVDPEHGPEFRRLLERLVAKSAGPV